MCTQRPGTPRARQFDVAEIRVDRPVTDRVERYDHTAATAPGNRMMPFDAPPKRACAEPAGVLRFDFVPCGIGRGIHQFIAPG